jgi:hypothetical protein
MMHIKFYAISILFLIVVSTCFILIAMGHGTDQGMAAGTIPNNDLDGIQIAPDHHAQEEMQTGGEINNNLDTKSGESGG